MKTAAVVLTLPVVMLHATNAPMRQADAPPFRTTGAFIGISVANMEASSKWYQDKFGLKVIMPPTGGGDGRATVLEGGGLTVELMQHSRARPLRTAAPDVRANYEVHGIFKAGLYVADLDRTLAELRRRGVEVAMGPFPKRDDQPANVIIRDNAGNFLQLFGR